MAKRIVSKSKKKAKPSAEQAAAPRPGAKPKLVYFFGEGKAEGRESERALLGGKGATLHGMTALGLPVPPGFTISTQACTHFYANAGEYPRGLQESVDAALRRLERAMGKRFGADVKPLLVSVRSGAAVSMPGMMDTILNLGLNDRSVRGLAEQSEDPRFAFDCYRRLIAMYGDVVLGVPGHYFETALAARKNLLGVSSDDQLIAPVLEELAAEFKNIVHEHGGEFPEDPVEQLWRSIDAVFRSWNSPRAITYRKSNRIPDDLGTAVNVQAMVFGNMGNDCATGVAFTRDPSTGKNYFYGEFLINAQGEDVVAGTRTPLPINGESSQNGAGAAVPTLAGLMPTTYRELAGVLSRLEKHYRDMQDIEFTIENGKLYMLQARSGKRTAAAALRIAIDMVKEGQISEAEAILRVRPAQIDQLLHPRLDPSAEKEVMATGLPASPGAATGQVVFDPDTALTWANELRRKVILVRVETSPEDIHGMASAEGILTGRGGMTSHAAVVARGMGKPCVAGCGALQVDAAKKECAFGSYRIQEGDFITLDGGSGEVILGEAPTIQGGLGADFKTLMKWVDKVRRLRVRTNADTPADAKVARSFGAEGIGLCRTEHMFFDSDRIDVVREMILADTIDSRRAALQKILPMQRADFKGIFTEMAGQPVTIRLLDPPLHEFIPHEDAELRELADRLGVTFERIKWKAESLKEFNPMLGHRGCRLGISYPEIYETQVRAIIEAACELFVEKKLKITPEIMIPLVSDVRELAFVRKYCVAEAERAVRRYSEMLNKKLSITYTIGTMIELPRAALTAGEIAGEAEFFSFGTNDLTQTTYGLSRDDAGLFLQDYFNAKIFLRDPFASLDARGVGRLLEIAVQEGRAARPGLKIGICGEHGGDPDSVEFCHRLGLDYVSCSPYRVPIARLAAAQAVLKEKSRTNGRDHDD